MYFTFKISALLIMLLVPGISFGAVLAWDPNPVEEGVTHYKVYNVYSQAGSPDYTYAELADVSTIEVDIGTPTPVDCWVVTALNAEGLQSDYSEMLCEESLGGIPPPNSPIGKPSPLILTLESSATQ